MRRSAVFRASADDDSGAQPYPRQRRPGDEGEIFASGKITGSRVAYDAPDVDLGQLKKELKQLRGTTMKGEYRDTASGQAAAAEDANLVAIIRASPDNSDQKARFEEQLWDHRIANQFNRQYPSDPTGKRNKLLDDRLSAKIRLAELDMGNWMDASQNDKEETARAVEKLRPPYAPGTSADEIEKILDWLALKESQVENIEGDAVHQFIYIVAGHVGDTVERMLKYDTPRRRSDTTAVDVAGSDVQQQLEASTRALNTARDAAVKDLNQLRIYDNLKARLDFLAAVKATPERRRGDRVNENITAPAVARLYGSLPEGDSANVPSRRKIRAVADAMIRSGLIFDTFAQPDGVVENLSAEGNGLVDRHGKGADVFVDYLVYHSYDNMEFSDVDVIPSADVARLENLIKQSDDALGKISAGGVRERQAVTLGWLERSEMLRLADMSEELTAAINISTTLVTQKVPGLRALEREEHPENILINKSPRHFRSLFAELTAKMILRDRFYGQTRSNYDKNHARIALAAQRLLRVLEGYVFAAGEIQKNTNQRGWGAERIAYRPCVF